MVAFSVLFQTAYQRILSQMGSTSFSMDSIREAIGDLQILEIKEQFYSEILLEYKGKHRAIYENWRKQDEKGNIYVLKSGNCEGQFSYNHTASFHLPVNRGIWDTRNAKCKDVYKSIDYSNMPSVSVIIPFHNEFLATLLRTVHSILNRSPPQVLLEVILIDDGSTENLPCLHEELEKAVFTLDKVKLVRTTQREGSTVARLIGASYATGDILSYLDCHVEVNQGWLDPIVTHIQQNNKAVVMSLLDTIKNEDFSIWGSYATSHGGFKWNLDFHWKEIPERIQKTRKSETDPIPSPIMPAGAFALNRDWFIELGLFDPHMRIWGVDDVEFSFRAWQCGSQVEIMPCSRVAHIFRSIPYSFNDLAGRVIYHNAVRTAEITLETYKKYFYAQATQFSIDLNKTSLKIRKNLKQTLNCKDFQWFMENIIPEMPLPPEDAIYYDKIMLGSNEDKCLTLNQSTHNLNITNCKPLDKSQTFFINLNQDLIHLDTKLCLSVAYKSVKFQPCHVQFDDWFYDENLKHIRTENNKCLTNNNGLIKLSDCKKDNLSQKWRFTYHFDWTKKLSYL